MIRVASLIKFCGYKAELSAIFDQFLKMPYQERVGVADKVKCLDAFRETENAGKSDEKLGCSSLVCILHQNPIRQSSFCEIKSILKFFFGQKTIGHTLEKLARHWKNWPHF